MLVKSLDHNEGVANALNVGLEVIRSFGDIDFVARMDADDVSLLERIET